MVALRVSIGPDVIVVRLAPGDVEKLSNALESVESGQARIVEFAVSTGRRFAAVVSVAQVP